MNTFYKFGFYVAFILMWLFLFALCASHYRTIEFRNKYYAQLSAHVDDLISLNQCSTDLDMTIDLYTSNGNIAIMKHYCDRWNRYQEKRLRQAKK